MTLPPDLHFLKSILFTFSLSGDIYRLKHLSAKLHLIIWLHVRFKAFKVGEMFIIMIIRKYKDWGFCQFTFESRLTRSIKQLITDFSKNLDNVTVEGRVLVVSLFFDHCPSISNSTLFESVLHQFSHQNGSLSFAFTICKVLLQHFYVFLCWVVSFFSVLSSCS